MSTCDDFIVGGDGLIGRALAARLRQIGHKVITTSRRAISEASMQLDLANEIPLDSLPSRCATAYLLAADTSMIRCERDPAGTKRINVEQMSIIAGEMARRGAHISVVSTNLVLDGLEPRAGADAPIRPQNAYARQKAELERCLLEGERNASILRCTKVADTLRPLLKNWKDKLSGGEVIRPFSDLVCAPVPLAYVVEALVKLGTKRSRGVFQISADQDVSYAQVATVLASRLGEDAVRRVDPATSKEMNIELAALPRFTSLDSQATEHELGLAPVSAADVIDAITSEVAATG